MFLRLNPCFLLSALASLCTCRMVHSFMLRTSDLHCLFALLHANVIMQFTRSWVICNSTLIPVYFYYAILVNRCVLFMPRLLRILRIARVMLIIIIIYSNNQVAHWFCYFLEYISHCMQN